MGASAGGEVCSGERRTRFGERRWKNVPSVCCRLETDTSSVCSRLWGSVGAASHVKLRLRYVCLTVITLREHVCLTIRGDVLLVKGTSHREKGIDMAKGSNVTEYV